MLRSYVQRITVAAVWMRFHTHWGVNMQHVHFHCRSPPLTLQRKKKEARSDCCQKVTQWIFGHAVYIIHQIYQWFMRFENCGASKDLLFRPTISWRTLYQNSASDFWHRMSRWSQGCFSQSCAHLQCFGFFFILICTNLGFTSKNAATFVMCAFTLKVLSISTLL